MNHRLLYREYKMKHQCRVPIYNKRAVTIKTTTTTKKTYKNINFLLPRIMY